MKHIQLFESYNNGRREQIKLNFPTNLKAMVSKMIHIDDILKLEKNINKALGLPNRISSMTAALYIENVSPPINIPKSNELMAKKNDILSSTDEEILAMYPDKFNTRSSLMNTVANIFSNIDHDLSVYKIDYHLEYNRDYYEYYITNPKTLKFKRGSQMKDIIQKVFDKSGLSGKFMLEIKETDDRENRGFVEISIKEI